MEATGEDHATSSSSSEGPRVICNPRENDQIHAEWFDWESALKVIRGISLCHIAYVFDQENKIT